MSETLQNLVDVVIKGKIKEAKPLAEKALSEGISAKAIIFDGLNKAMETVGQKYEKKEFFLPDVLRSAQTFYQALDVALPKLDKETARAQGKVVLAVVEGDVHDIGKNIVKAMIAGAGLTVVDMGRDIPIKIIVEKAKSENANILATSTLMTQTLMGMKDIERLMKDGNLKPKIKTIIGGGATSKEFANQIGADGWAPDAIDAVKVMTGLLKH